MGSNQDQGHETAAGDLDGLFETASKGGRMDTDPDAPQMVAAQVQKSSELDQVLPPKNNLSERIKLGEAQEVATKPTGTGMDDMFSTSGRHRVSSGDGGEGHDVPSSGGSMDELFGGRGSGRMRLGRAAAEESGSGMDDLFGSSRSGTKRARQDAPTSSMDDLFGPSKRR